MKKSILFFSTSISLFLSAFTYANDHVAPYVEAKAGPAFSLMEKYQVDTYGNKFNKKTNTETGFFGSLVLGYKLCNPYRFGAEITYRRFDPKLIHNSIFKIKTTIDSWNIMANFYYDFNLCSYITPYFGTGIGYMYNIGNFSARGTKFYKNLKKVTRRKTEGKFAWQGIVGINYAICDNTEILAEYRMMQNEDDNVLSFGVKRYF